MATGVTLTFNIGSLDNIYRVTSHLTMLLSKDTTAENARLVPDVDKGTVYLEIPEIEPDNEFIQKIIEEFKSLDAGEVQIKNFVMPEWARELPSERAQQVMLETVSTSPPGRVQKQLEEKSDPKVWLPEQLVELRFTVEDLGSKVTSLMSELDKLKAEMVRIKTKEELSEKAQKKFYERSSFWIGLVGVTIAIASLIVSLIAAGFFAPP